jgi:glycosyltransferase involved in cell wall biosynthesis
MNAPMMLSIPNGIRIQPLRIQNNFYTSKRIVFTGRLCHQKGIDLLIVALHALKIMGYRFKLDIFGDGPLKKNLEKLINELSLGNQILLKGLVPAEELRNRLIQYDVFVLSSRYEGMSNSALEAMEAGIPVMVTRCGGIDEHIDATIGWVCEPEDLISMQNTLKAIMHTSSEELKLMGRRARKMVVEKFEIGLIARKNLALFKYVLDSARK